MAHKRGFERKFKNFNKKGSCFILDNESWFDYAMDIFINFDEPSDPDLDVIPERRLCFAILARAMADAKGITSFSSEANPTPKKETKAASDARDWILSEEDHPWSFLWICQEVDIPSQRISFIRAFCCGH